MTDQLLPPDPSMRAWYFLRRGALLYAFEFLPRPDKYRRDWWHRNAPWPDRKETPEHMYREGYRLASPHPILGPSQLDALHDLEDRLSFAQLLTPDGRVILSVVLRDIRAALGSKPSPNDPPGNSLDDVRAAAMDQWGAPRPGKEPAP